MVEKIIDRAITSLRANGVEINREQWIQVGLRPHSGLGDGSSRRTGAGRGGRGPTPAGAQAQASLNTITPQLLVTAARPVGAQCGALALKSVRVWGGPTVL